MKNEVIPATKATITELHATDCIHAWELINEYLVLDELNIILKNGGQYGPQMCAYNCYMHIESLKFNPNFDFGTILGYSKKKWTSLVNNYVDFNYLDLIKSELQIRGNKQAKSYNYSYHFINVHGSGKDCLISLVFTKRLYCDHPIVVFHIRTSEVTKRLPFDLLLVKRICEYVYGKGQRVSLELWAPSMYATAESFALYNNHKSIIQLMRPLKKRYGKFQKRVLQIYREFKTKPLDEIKYKVHHRSAANLQKDAEGNSLSGTKPLFAKELILIPSHAVDYPKEAVTPKLRAQHNRKNKPKKTYKPRKAKD